VNGAQGEVSVIRYCFSDSFYKPELTFIEQHSVTIVISATLSVILIVAILVKIKNNATEKEITLT